MNTDSAESATTPEVGATGAGKKATSKKGGATKPKKGATQPTNDNSDEGTDTAKRWAIKGADNEAILTFQRAAKKRGKKINQFFNEDIRQFCVEILTKKSEVPAAPVDVADMIKAEMQTAGQQLEDRILERLSAIVQSIQDSQNSNAQKNVGWFERIFGSKKGRE